MKNPIARVTQVVLAAIGGLGDWLLGSGALSSEEVKKTAVQDNSDPPALGNYVDANGTIRLPEDYRLRWTHMASYYVEGADQGTGNMHDVYAEPEAVEAFQKTGKFPPGATIVKEIRSSSKSTMTTGEAHWDAGIAQRFVLVKDANQPTFPGSPKWGRGWGWALFNIKEPKKDISTG
jgi:hypothetical protein